MNCNVTTGVSFLLHCREAIQPEILEESILSAVIKHFDLTDTVRNITQHEEHQTEEFLLLKDIMSETYKHTYAMIRQLQVEVGLMRTFCVIKSGLFPTLFNLTNKYLIAFLRLLLCYF